MNRKENRPSKIAFEKHLNQQGIPEGLPKSKGGVVPDYVKYGTWLRVNDPAGFETGYHAWKDQAREQGL